MSSNPKVSVVIATYRRDDSLKNAIESVLNQTYNNCEVIIVDDNDSQEWNNKVKKIINNIKKNSKGLDIKLIENHPNLGSARTRNIGINASTGEYITFLDDDDIYLQNKVKKQVEHMIETNADYSITDLNLYNEKGKLIDTRKRSYLNSKKNKSLLECHLMYHMTGTDTFMFKKSYLATIGNFDEIDIGDEFYLMLKAINNNGKMCYVPDCDVKAFVHTGDTGLSSGQSKIEGETALYDFKAQFFDDLNKKNIRYIKMRHYAVLAVANLKLKRYGIVIRELFKSFVSSPIECIKLYVKRK